jgi:hypothetical protein
MNTVCAFHNVRHPKNKQVWPTFQVSGRDSTYMLVHPPRRRGDEIPFTRSSGMTAFSNVGAWASYLRMNAVLGNGGGDSVD